LRDFLIFSFALFYVRTIKKVVYIYIKLMSKAIIIFFLILAAAGIGYWIYQSNTAVEEKDEISTLLEELKTETEIDFSEVSLGEFQWKAKEGEEVKDFSVEGKSFEVKEISSEDYNKIDSFFKNKEFEVDLYNVSSGTVSGSVGYKKDNIVCLVQGGITGYKEAEDNWVPPDSDKKDVEVKCGKAESLPALVISAEEEVKKLFAEKYNTKVSAVTLNIEKETENHMRGGVVIEPGGSENSGIFLATKVEGIWKLVFDGNGSISCEELEEYNFPEDMVANCYNLPATTEIFCGWATYGNCTLDSDCTRGGCSSQVCQSKNEESIATTCEYRDCYNPDIYNIYCKCVNQECMWTK